VYHPAIYDDPLSFHRYDPANRSPDNDAKTMI